MRQSFRGFIALLIIFSGILGNALPLRAQVDRLVGFTPPDDHIGEPRNTGGGGSRGKCRKDSKDQPPLTILVPKLPRYSKDMPLRGGLTTTSFPSLFVYVPKTVADTGEFFFLEHREDGTLKEIEIREFSLPNESGIIRLSTPIALEEGKTYEWHFALICDRDDRSTDAVAVSTIERISLPDRLAQIETASLETQVKLYGQAGLWYDFFARLTETMAQSPQFQEVWQTVLRQNIDPEHSLARASLISCCSIASEEE